MSTTDRYAKPFPGHRPYQKRAEKILPILVQVAQRQTSISYKQLAAKVGMRARNLNYPLGSIGNKLKELSKERGTKIPPIVSLVVNNITRVPGKGGWYFIGNRKPESLSRAEKRTLFDQACRRIWRYRHWPRVLVWAGLPASTRSLEDLASAAAQSGGRGESAAHRDLKLWVADHPGQLGLTRFRPGSIESALSSGDRLDVLFEAPGQCVAVEVKTANATEAELARGLFQCVKYEAVIRAEMSLKPASQRAAVQVLLVTPAPLTSALVKLQRRLQVRVVRPRRLPHSMR